jgi:hypothetical protein
VSDVATLGLAVDSRQVKSAATDLDRLQGSANGAAAAADKLTAASGKTNTAARAITGATTPAVAATNALAVASNNAAKAHQGMSTQAMAAQHSIRSLAEALASGQPLTQALGQQLNHLSYAASGPGGITAAFKQATGALVGLITPASAVALGIAAIGTAGVLAFINLEKMALAFDDVSRSVGTTAGQLHGLQQAASFKGIGQDDFFKAMEKFGANVYEAQHNMGGLADVMRANGQTAKDFNGYLERAADLIKNATSDQQRLQLLQQMGLPATMEWVRFLSQGKDGIRAATAEAAKFNESAEGKLVASARKFDDAWNTATTKMVNTFKAGMADVVTSLASVQVPQWLLNVGRGAAGGILGGPLGLIAGGIKGAVQNGNSASFGDRFGSFETTGNAGQLQQGLANRAASLTGAKQTVDPNVIKDQISKEQQRLALLGPLATAEEQVRAKQLEINAAALNGVGISKDQANAVLLVTRAQAEMSRVQEQAAIGISRTADATKAMNDNLQSLVARKLLDPNNPQEYAAAINNLTRQMEDLSDQAKVAASALPQFQAALNDATSARKQLDGLATETMSVNRGFFVEFGQQLRQGASAWDAFKSAGLNALGKIADKLMGMAADNLFANAFGGKSGGGGLFGMLGGMFGMPTGAVNANGSITGAVGATSVGGAPLIGANASGTDNWRGGLTMVGEKGPELVNLPRGSQVLNNGQTRGMLGGAGGGPPVIMQDNRVLNIGQGASAETVLQLREELARDKAARYADTVRIVQSAKKRRDI